MAARITRTLSHLAFIALAPQNYADRTQYNLDCYRFTGSRGGVWLSLSELVLVYMNWYSGVEYEPPLTSMDRLFQWLRIAVTMVTVAVVALNYLMPTAGLLFSVIFRQAR